MCYYLPGYCSTTNLHGIVKSANRAYAACYALLACKRCSLRPMQTGSLLLLLLLLLSPSLSCCCCCCCRPRQRGKQFDWNARALCNQKLFKKNGCTSPSLPPILCGRLKSSATFAAPLPSACNSYTVPGKRLLDTFLLILRHVLGEKLLLELHWVNTLRMRISSGQNNNNRNKYRAWRMPTRPAYQFCFLFFLFSVQ